MQWLKKCDTLTLPDFVTCIQEYAKSPMVCALFLDKLILVLTVNICLFKGSKCLNSFNITPFAFDIIAT